MLHHFGSKEYIQFDACPKCGFGKAATPTQDHGATSVIIIDGEELWDVLKFIYGFSREELYNNTLKEKVEQSDIQQTVFEYTQEEVEEHQNRNMVIFGEQ